MPIGQVARPPVRTPSASSSRSSSAAGGSSLLRAAASSSASGRPSRRRAIAALPDRRRRSTRRAPSPAANNAPRLERRSGSTAPAARPGRAAPPGWWRSPGPRALAEGARRRPWPRRSGVRGCQDEQPRTLAERGDAVVSAAWPGSRPGRAPGRWPPGRPGAGERRERDDTAPRRRRPRAAVRPHGEPGLTDPARAGERDEASALAHQARHGGQLGSAPPTRGVVEAGRACARPTPPRARAGATRPAPGCAGTARGARREARARAARRAPVAPGGSRRARRRACRRGTARPSAGRAQALPQRLGGDERLELDDRAVVIARRQAGLDTASRASARWAASRSQAVTANGSSATSANGSPRHSCSADSSRRRARSGSFPASAARPSASRRSNTSTSTASGGASST